MSLPTLADCKAHLGVDYSDDDAQITAMLEAAIVTLERHVGADINGGRSRWFPVRLGAQAVRLVALRRYELNEPASITIRGVDTSGSLITHTSATGFAVLSMRWSADVRLSSELWEAFKGEASEDATVDTSLPVQVSFATGVAEADIPADWREVVLVLVGERYNAGRGDMPAPKRLVSEELLRRISPRG